MIITLKKERHNGLSAVPFLYLRSNIYFYIVALTQESLQEE
jgi:hypothetical protein